jgi:hypothetical protein
MTERMILHVDIRSYWHPGTGRGLGTQLDAITHRNARGLPTLPGRTLKGLLRDAVYRWEQFGGFADLELRSSSIAEQLFGPRGIEGVETWPGLLRVGDAVLAATDTAYLAADPKLCAGLYHSHFATAVEHETGTAAEKTLRGIELVVPLKLFAEITTIATAAHVDLADRWPDILRTALPLVWAVGAHRSRGLGRAVLTLEDAP